MSNNTLTITDNRTGKTYELPVENDTIRALDLRQIKVNPDDFGMMTYDPAYLNTASCKSDITYIQGDAGILRYRGYPIEQLAEHSNFLEVAYLLIYGELPNSERLGWWENRIMRHTYVHNNLTEMISGFRYDAHPMSILISSVSAMGSFYPEARRFDNDPAIRDKQIWRLLGKLPTIAAMSYRHRIGRPYNQPCSDYGYAGNFLYMLDYLNQTNYEVHPTLAKALDVLFILHADHEQNCSTSVMRAVGSSRVDPFSALAAASAALYGPLHGGANEAALRMLKQIGSVDQIPHYVEKVKKGEFRLMGFGHRVYKNYDPRARIIKGIADQVFEVTGSNPLIDVARTLEEIALNDDYFIQRKLYPNVDFYSGIIYQAMGFPTDMFPVLFAIPRAAGWLAQWLEMTQDREQRISRPRQVYLGADERNYMAIENR